MRSIKIEDFILLTKDSSLIKDKVKRIKANGRILAGWIYAFLFYPFILWNMLRICTGAIPQGKPFCFLFLSGEISFFISLDASFSFSKKKRSDFLTSPQPSPNQEREFLLSYKDLSYVACHHGISRFV
jgi:hypothetical protein